MISAVLLRALSLVEGTSRDAKGNLSGKYGHAFLFNGFEFGVF